MMKSVWEQTCYAVMLAVVLAGEVEVDHRPYLLHPSFCFIKCGTWFPSILWNDYSI